MPKTISHSPTLESVLMVEAAIKKHSQELGKYQLWKNNMTNKTENIIKTKNPSVRDTSIYCF